MSATSATQLNSIAYLDALYLRPIRPPAEVGLRRISYLLGHLGDPQQTFRSVHITGTCGKGSTTTMIGSILQAAGFKTGIFRSPHMDSYHDRIAINEEVIGAHEWEAAFAPVRAVGEAMEAGEARGYDLGRPSLFDVLWATAALHFASSGVEFGAIEVGMGGRLDPTNVLDSEVAVVTNVSLDHVSVLGPTVIDIAREKAAIFKPGRGAVTAATQPEVLDLIRDSAHNAGGLLWQVGHEVTVKVRRHDMSGELFDVETPLRGHKGLKTSMLGIHQATNAATAVAAIDQLEKVEVLVDHEAVAAGLAAATFPGRFEIVGRDPIIVLDGAHNEASAGVLRATLDDLFPDHRIVLLIGILGDKDASAIISHLGPRARDAFVTQPPWETRAADPQRIIDALSPWAANATRVDDIGEAMNRAISSAAADDVVLVTGSLYLVAEVRARLKATRTISSL